MKRSPLYILLLLMALACKPTVPSEYIQPSELEDLLYDYHVAEAMAKNDGAGEIDFKRNLYFQEVLKKHHVTEADFDSSLVYYYSHVDKLKEIYSHVSERIADEAKRLGTEVGDINRYSQYSASGDTANIWTATSHVLLIPRPTKNRFEFTIKADSIFRVGDSFMFQFMTEHIWQTGSKDAVVCLCAAYEGDSIMQVVSHSSVSGIVQLRLPANRTQKLRELRGFIYLTSDGEETDSRKLMFVSQIQLIRFHNKEIQEKYEQAKQDSAYKAPHSMSRGDISDRQQQDTTGRGADERLRSQSAPFRRGGGKH